MEATHFERFVWPIRSISINSFYVRFYWVRRECVCVCADYRLRTLSKSKICTDNELIKLLNNWIDDVRNNKINWNIRICIRYWQQPNENIEFTNCNYIIRRRFENSKKKTIKPNVLSYMYTMDDKTRNKAYTYERIEERTRHKYRQVRIALEPVWTSARSLARTQLKLLSITGQSQLYYIIAQRQS